jgi:hypothetical protein
MTIAHPMRKLVMTLALLALAAPAAASAQAHLSIRIGLPAVLPPLVVVEPGVKVVQDFGEEIFFVDGYYWMHRDHRWYRAHDHRASWTFVEPRWVPAALVRMPHGYYRHWQAEHRHPHWRQKHSRPHAYHEHARQHWREEQGRRHGKWEHEKGERREWREARWHPANQQRHGRGHR